jgi:hypothetical protein
MQNFMEDIKPLLVELLMKLWWIWLDVQPHHSALEMKMFKKWLEMENYGTCLSITISKDMLWVVVLPAKICLLKMVELIRKEGSFQDMLTVLLQLKNTKELSS